MTLFTDKILQFFHDDGWPLLEVDSGKTWQLTFKGTQGLWTCYAEIREEFFQFTFYSICPINVPEHKRAAVAELLTRVNSRLQLGNFEMDFDSGDLRALENLSGQANAKSLISMSFENWVLQGPRSLRSDWVPVRPDLVSGRIERRKASTRGRALPKTATIFLKLL